MANDFSPLHQFIDQNTDLKLLISQIQKSYDEFWLVGGCLRNSILDLPQIDIDIACSTDPTPLIRKWSKQVLGRWFWLDEKRKQSRVLLKNGLTVDFAPLRAPSILEDLYLRDFTINAVAIPLDRSFPNSECLDPLSGIVHLNERQLLTCSDQSFYDDPLRMLKGIRHAVTLDLHLTKRTLHQIASLATRLSLVAGERIKDELGKILDSKNNVAGIVFLIETGLLSVLFGPAGENWEKDVSIKELNFLDQRIKEVMQVDSKYLNIGHFESFTLRAIYLFASLLKNYSPHNQSALLQTRLRLSRKLQRLLNNLQSEPASTFLQYVGLVEGQRKQALLVEQIEPFAFEKMVYWVCHNQLKLKQVLELQQSFTAEKKSGRIPDLLNGKLITTLLSQAHKNQICQWQLKLKQAEIDGQIESAEEAEKWLTDKLKFDNEET